MTTTTLQGTTAEIRGARTVSAETKHKQAPVYDFGMPRALWSEVLPGLWQGGTDDDDVVNRSARRPGVTLSDFGFVATLYASANPVDWFVIEMRFGIYDSDMADFDAADLLDIVAVTHRQWKAGKQVLVRCQAGLNRSGLVMALVLIREGYSADDAIDLIRQRRGSSALCNRRFVAWLRETDIELWRATFTGTTGGPQPKPRWNESRDATAS